MPSLARITIYPIKSFDGVSVDAALFTGGGGLANDRRFVFRDQTGAVINGKHFPAIHSLRVRYETDFTTAHFTFSNGAGETFRLTPGNEALNARMSSYLGRAVHLEENADGGFPDDPGSPGPTVIAVASVEAVMNWFPSLTLEEVRRRFRANLEIGDCPAFWEDQLFAEDASPETRTVVPFHIGHVPLNGVNPCARCPVPTRDSQTGEPYPRFAQLFGQHRRETLPSWAPLTAFDHYYRLSVNTRPAPTTPGGRITIGDEVTLDTTS